jgi:hypothetical protein
MRKVSFLFISILLINVSDKVLCVGTDDIPVRSLPFLIDVVGEKPRSFTKPVPQSDGKEYLNNFVVFNSV